MQEPVNHEIDCDRQQRDSGGRNQRRNSASHDESCVLLHHRAPIGCRRLNAQAEERQRADREKDETEAQAELRHQRRQDVGQNFAKHDPAELLALELGRLDEIEHDDVHGDGASHAIDASRIQHGNDQDQIEQRGADDRQQHHGEDELRDRHQHVDRTAEKLIDPAAQHSRQQAEDAAERE
jgi:hypothetical protein